MYKNASCGPVRTAVEFQKMIIYYSAGLTSGIPAVILRTVEKLRSSIGVPQNLKKARLNIKCATE
jgi:hypothetical protein